MVSEINIENKSTKEVVVDYLKKNKGREIPIYEISETFNFKLNRISNAIKELDLAGEINVERRPLKKGKYTVISLRGDTITQFASHERELTSRSNEEFNDDKTLQLEHDEILEIIKLLKSVNYTQTKLQRLIESRFDNYFSLVIQIIQPLLYEVGQLWQDGEISIAEEHIISARIEKFLIDLIKIQYRKGSKTIILAPVEHETHRLSLLVLELLLVERGFHVINLSNTIPVLSLIEFIKTMNKKPDWIFFSITLESFVTNLKMDIKLIKEQLSDYDIKIAVGGQGISKFPFSYFSYIDKIIKNSSELQEFLLTLL